MQVERLIEDGVDVRGYMYWTLIDNFEWNFAWELKFGIYEWNPDMGQERRLRKGAEVRFSKTFSLNFRIRTHADFLVQPPNLRHRTFQIYPISSPSDDILRFCGYIEKGQ